MEIQTRLASSILAPNPSKMTLDGTNTYILRSEESRGCVIVDPGPDDADHLQRLLRVGQVDLILLTHRHADHSALARQLAAATGAPVRAPEAELCIEAPPLIDSEIIEAAGCQIQVVSTPGHSGDSTCFYLPQDSPYASEPHSQGGSMLTGDTILGRGSTVIVGPDGTVADYLDSLEKLRLFGAIQTLPGHGPTLPDLSRACLANSNHRRSQVSKVTAALQQIGRAPGTDAETVSAVTDIVYSKTPTEIRRAAEMTARAQLTYLAQRADNLAG